MCSVPEIFILEIIAYNGKYNSYVKKYQFYT